MVQQQLQQLLLAARQCLKQGKPDHAVGLLSAALKLDSHNALGLFLLGTAHAALAQHACAADAYLQAVRLTASAPPGSQRQQLHVAAAENLLLEADKVLPPGWVAALHDAPRLEVLQQGVAAAVQAAAAAHSSCGSGAAGQRPPRVLVCGGIGVEAVLAVHAGAGSATVFCDGNPLAARLAAELAAASGCAGRVATTTSTQQLHQLAAAEAASKRVEGPAGPSVLAPPLFYVLILADALGPSIDWDLLRRQAAAAAPLLAGSSNGGEDSGTAPVLVLPHAVHICGAVIECRAAVALNEVDVTALHEETGGLDLGAANGLLPLATRSICLPNYPHTVLAGNDSAPLLSIPLAILLPNTANSLGSSDGMDGGGSATAAAPGVVAAGAATLAVSSAGTADALCWWYEQQLTAAGRTGTAGAIGASPLVMSARPDSFTAGEAMLHPHLWQHLQYLDHCQLIAGQAAEVRCQLGTGGTAAAAEAELGAAGGGQIPCPVGNACSKSVGAEDTNASSAAASTGIGNDCKLSLQFDVLVGGNGNSSSGDRPSTSMLLPVQQPEIAAAVPRYHTSMLNDAARTAVYREGIAGALRQSAALRAAAGAAAGKSGAAETVAATAVPEPAAALAVAPAGTDPGLVLEIGSGSGLLCLLACQARARQVIGCERLQELQAAAACLLGANGVTDRVTISPKHSKELTVAPAEAVAPEVAAAGATAGVAADLPRRADVLIHEIFGTDPFSEGVLPTLVHAKQHLLAPGATLAPCKVHVVAAVAASATQHCLLRPPPAMCGGAVVMSALRQLAPRKVDCQAGEAPGLYLLTAPCRVLSVDFEAAELALDDASSALLECLPQPLLLADWMATARQADACTAGTAGAPNADLVSSSQAAGTAPTATTHSSSGAVVAASGGASWHADLAGASLYAVSWFEYEFPGGTTGSTAPHLQRSEHWQQVVQTLEGPAATALLQCLSGGGGGAAADGSGGLQEGGRGAADSDGSGCNDGSRREGGASGAAGLGSSAEVALPQALLLTTGYRVDRLWFELAGVAALTIDSDSDSDSGGEA